MQIARSVWSSLVGYGGYGWFNRGMLVFGWVLSKQTVVWFGLDWFSLVWVIGFRFSGGLDESKTTDQVVWIAETNQTHTLARCGRLGLSNILKLQATFLYYTFRFLAP